MLLVPRGFQAITYIIYILGQLSSLFCPYKKEICENLFDETKIIFKSIIKSVFTFVLLFDLLWITSNQFSF